MGVDFKEIRKQFPAIQQSMKSQPVIYFDSACMTIPPIQVIDAVSNYYSKFPACHGRAMHHFGQQVTKKFEQARSKVQRLINSKYSDEIVFVRNATEGINLIAQSFELKEGDAVLCSNMEHNSNLLPWQRLVASKHIELRIFRMNDDSTFSMENFAAELDPSVKLISIMHTSNVTGVTLPVREISSMAHKNDIPLLLDATQSVAARQVDVQDLDIDFMVFSMHKSYGPSGVGVLYGKRSRLATLEPLLLGGESVDDSTYHSYTLAPVPHRFEAGLQNYAGVIGSGAAVDFLMGIQPEDILKHYLMLNTLITDGMNRFSGARILGPQDPGKCGSIVNFIIEGKRSYDLALLLDQANNIMVRPGKHCVHSWYNAKKLDDSVRVSFGVYNTEEEALKFLDVLKKLIRFF